MPHGAWPPYSCIICPNELVSTLPLTNWSPRVLALKWSVSDIYYPHCIFFDELTGIDNGSTYELFGSSDISLGRLFWYRRFDNGMVAFLMCLKEMGDFAEQRDKTFHMPHKMEKDKVGEMSIKIQFNNEETWTKSLKYMLTNLKWLLAWVVKVEAEQFMTKHGKFLQQQAENNDSSNNNNGNNNSTNNLNGVNNNMNNANGIPPSHRSSRLTLLFASRA